MEVEVRAQGSGMLLRPCLSPMSDHKYGATYGFTAIAEKLNGRLAMIGLVAALGAYAITGEIIPGIF